MSNADHATGFIRAHRLLPRCPPFPRRFTQARTAPRASPPSDLILRVLGLRSKGRFLHLPTPIFTPPLSLCPHSSLSSRLLLHQAVRAASRAPPHTRTDVVPPRRPSPKSVPSALFPGGRLIIAGHPRSTSVPTGISPSFVVAPQCSTAPPTAPKTAGQPPSPACPFRQGSPSWLALLSFFQPHFCPQIDSPHAGAAQTANTHSAIAGHRRNRSGAASECRRPSLPCFLVVGCQPRPSQPMCWAGLEAGQTLAQGAQCTFIFSSDLI
jgi:hypothetical protein